MRKNLGNWGSDFDFPSFSTAAFNLVDGQQENEEHNGLCIYVDGIFTFSDNSLPIRVKRLIQLSVKNGLVDENVSHHIFHGRTTSVLTSEFQFHPV